MMFKFRHWLIRKIAAGDMVLVNANINGSLVKGGRPVAYFARRDERMPISELREKAVLTPIRSAIY